MTNGGTVTLSGTLAISDDKIGSSDITCGAVPDGGLAPSASVTCSGTYTVVQADLDAGGVTNKASASLDGVTSNEATATVPWKAPQESTEPQVSIELAVQVAEDAGTAEVAVSLSESSLQTVTVDYATSDGTATAGTDYVASSSTLTFAPGITEQKIPVTVINDAVDEEEENETFTITLTGPNNASLDASSGTVTITDDDDPAVTASFGQAAYSVDEGSTVEVTVTLSADPEREVAVQLTHDPQGNTGSADYSGVPESLVFQIGDTEKSFTFSATADEVDDDGESVALGFGTMPDRVTAGTTATVTITDDDTAGVTVSETALSIDEGAAGSYTVALDTEPTGNVTVAVAGHSGTDITLSGATLTNDTLTFTSENWDTAQTVTVSAAQDDDAASDAAVTLTHTVSGTGEYAGVSAGSVTVTIVEKDASVLSVNNAEAAEDSGNVVFTVSISAASGQEVTVNYATSGVTAMAGQDYTETTGTLTFAANSVASQTISVPVADDAVDEAEEETFTLTLSSAQGASLAGGESTLAVTGTITDDDDPAVTASFGQSAYSVDEGSTVEVTVTLSVDPEREVAVQLTHDPQGNTGSADYSGVPGSLVFQKGDTEKSFTFSATADDVDDDGESVALGFGTMPDRVTAGATATVTITDDDAAGVTISESTLTIAEGGSSTYTVVLNTEPTGTVTVTIGGTNTDVSVDDTTLTFTDQDWNTALTVTVTAVEDAVDEDSDTFTLTHTVTSTDSDYNAFATAGVTVNVTDDDTAGVTISENILTIDEGSSATYTVVLDTQPTGNVTVTPGGTSGTDVSASPAVLTFTTDNWNDTQTITVSAAQDADPVNDTATITHTVASDNDSKYDGIGAGDVAVTVDDDETQAQELTLTMPVPVHGDTDGDGGINLGDTLAYTATATNSGNVPLEDVNVQDLLADTNGNDCASLAVGGTCVLTGAHTVTQANVDAGKVTNTATATATGAATKTVTRETGVNQVQGLTLEKTTTDSGFSEVGDELDYSYKATNSGTVTLTGALEIDDDRMASADITCPDVPDAGLAPNGSLTCTGSYTVTQADIDEGEVENTATASLGGATSPQDTVTVSWRAPQGTLPALSIAGGNVQEDDSSITLEVTLSPASLQTVTVDYDTANESATAGADYTASSGTLTFAPGDTGKTVTVMITDDDIDEDNETLKVNLTNPSNANITSGSETGTVTIQDDDTAGVTVSETALSIDEGGSASYTVVLDTQPTHSVTVTINDPSNTDVTADPASLTFTSEDWDDEQTVTVSAGEDAGADDETATVTHAAASTDAKYSGISVEDVEVSVTDGSKPDLVLSRASASIQETATVDFTVKLATEPSAQVTVAVSSGDTGAVSVSTASLTFTTTEWDTAQTVTVTALDDDDTSDETVTVTATASSSDEDYQGKSAALTVSITDDDTRGLVISESSLDVAEGDATGEAYTVRLATEPTGDVTVAISGHAGTDLSLDETSLTFTTANWDTARTVTVTAGRDDDSTNDSVTLTHAASGGGYNSIAKTLAVIIQDDTPDSVTANFEQATYTVQEGSSVTVKVKLNEDPKRSVTIPITKSNQDGASDSDYSGVPANVTFSSGDTEKSFTFSATMDSADDDGESVRIALGTMPTGVSKGTTRETVVSITDDDVPSVTVSFEQSTYTVAESDDPSTTEVQENEAAIKVTLSAEPERSVTVSITKTDQGGATSADYSGMPDSVAFAATETEKSITFTAAGDDIDDDGESVKLTFGPTLPTGVSAGSTDEATVSITDDDTAGVTVSETSLTFGEGSTGTYTVVLTSQPTGDVTVTITGHSETDLTLSGETLTDDALTFTPDDWNTAQRVTVTAGEDDDAVNEAEATLTHAASGGGYGSVNAQDVAVTVTDDDSVGVTVTPTELTITEGNSAPYSVVLNTEPSAEVTVALSLSDADADVSVSPDSLTFTASNWDQEQTIEVSTVEDEDTEKDPSVTISHAVTGGDYEGVNASQVEVNLLEKLHVVNPGDTPESWLINNPPPAGVSVVPTSLTVPEGGSGGYAVALDAQPSSTVTIKVNAPGALSVSPGSLVFTADDYAAKTVTVTAGEDDDATSEVVGITHDITGGGYNVVNTAGVVVNITDNDTADVTVAPTALTIGEGETGQYTVVLDTEPSDNVTVSIAVPSGTDLSVSPSGPLTFTAATWSQAQAVTVTAGEDDDAETDPPVTLTHTVTGGDYEGEDAAGVTVSITENDQVEPPAVAVSFEKDFHEVAEGAHSVGVGILLDNAAEGEVTIPIDVLSRSTASAEDYSGVPGNVTFAPGATFKTIWIVPTLEAVEEDDEEIWLGFGSLPDWVSAGAYDQTHVTIFDAAHLSFGSSSYVATEGRGDAIVAVRLNKPLPHAVSIPLTAEGGSGATSDDWSGVPQEVTFAAGEVEKTFTVIAVDDAVEDDGEMVTLGFGTLSDRHISDRLIAVSPATTVVTLVNMENGLDAADPPVPTSPHCQGTTAAVGSVYTGTIETAGETDWWTVELDPQKSYTIHTRGADIEGGGTLPRAETLQFSKSDGRFFTAYRHSTAVGIPTALLAEFNIWLTKPGIYCFEVGTREADEQGTYSLEVELHGYDHNYDVPADTNTKKTFATPVTHHMIHGFLGDHGGSEPDEDWFRARLEGGVAYRILLSADTHEEERHQLTRPKVVGIHHADGTAIDGTVSTGTGQSVSVDFIPPRSGNYYIAVGSNSSDATGMFVLCARVIAQGDADHCGGRGNSNSGYTPPLAPRNLRVSSGNSHELDASWQPVSSSSGPGKDTATYGYKVQWKKASDSWEDQEEITVSHRVPGASYTITGLEDGTGYTVRVRAFNFMGVGDASAEASASPEQGQGTELQDYNSPATGGPGIRGTPRVGNTLNATTQDIADEDGMTGAVFTYQWVRHDFGTRTDTDIDGATGASYTVASGDAGQGIKVQVSFTDDAGHEESLTSYAVAVPLPPLTADFPQSPYQSLSHQGADDRPQLIVTFSRAVPSIAKTTPSVLVTGGTVSSVRAHEEDWTGARLGILPRPHWHGRHPDQPAKRPIL